MRYVLSTVDVSNLERITSVVESYDTLREAMEAGRASEVPNFIIYDTIEQRTLINYGEQE